jgi:hypothetical protein
MVFTIRPWGRLDGRVNQVATERLETSNSARFIGAISRLQPTISVTRIAARRLPVVLWPHASTHRRSVPSDH